MIRIFVVLLNITMAVNILCKSVQLDEEDRREQEIFHAMVTEFESVLQPPSVPASNYFRDANTTCSSVCVHGLYSKVGCDFYRLRERLPHLQYCFTGQAAACPLSYSSYCWNKRAAMFKGIPSPRCDSEGFACGDTTVSRDDLRSMDCKCSVMCDETCY